MFRPGVTRYPADFLSATSTPLAPSLSFQLILGLNFSLLLIFPSAHIPSSLPLLTAVRFRAETWPPRCPP